MEITGNIKLILTLHAKIASESIMITKLAIRFCWHRKVFSAKQKAHTARSHGLSQQFIQIKLSGFNAECNRKDLLSGE